MTLFEVAITSGGTHRTLYVVARDTVHAYDQVRDLESATVKVAITGSTLDSYGPADLRGVMQ